eukprot:CAMPEP_0195080634 /NCGR_PEP_ID=MMETSP0448-20130528/22296_1 /TAXON_ID=66468 /ORGANISM="Heterocapsa triquestra, Strain CCMP 448" /LENGTH=51 /DNA_ID=CAMNT_0040113599 /DNA_START=130 /DNA_END=282 /DNA_ORIENTATION=+
MEIEGLAAGSRAQRRPHLRPIEVVQFITTRSPAQRRPHLYPLKEIEGLAAG